MTARATSGMDEDGRMGWQAPAKAEGKKTARGRWKWWRTNARQTEEETRREGSNFV